LPSPFVAEKRLRFTGSELQFRRPRFQKGLQPLRRFSAHCLALKLS
jgi:hypothetical protein